MGLVSVLKEPGITLEMWSCDVCGASVKKSNHRYDLPGRPVFCHRCTNKHKAHRIRRNFWSLQDPDEDYGCYRCDECGGSFSTEERGWDQKNLVRGERRLLHCPGCTRKLRIIEKKRDNQNPP